MAANDGKFQASDESSKWAEEFVDCVEKGEKEGEPSRENQKTGLKSSWSGWFQRMNDAVINAVTEEEPKKTKEETGGSEDDAARGESQEDKESWGNWGSTFLKQAKEKTLSTFELVKKDLTEFTDVVQKETASIVNTTTTKVRERAPGLVDTIVGTVNSVLVEDTTRGEEENEVPITANDVAALYANRAQARLYAIQSDPGTYCNEPDGAPELFDDWLDQSFNLQEKKEEISQLLVNNPTVRNLFTKLVPFEVSNTAFWQRYFYKLHQLELDEARRQALIKREGTTIVESTDNLRLSWGDESESDIHPEHIDNAETESFCDLTQDTPIDSPPTEPRTPSPTTAGQQSPLCGRKPPEGANAIPRSVKGKKRNSFNVEMDAAEQEEQQQNSNVHPLQIDSSVDTPSRKDDSPSPADKKSDGWVEWDDSVAAN